MKALSADQIRQLFRNIRRAPSREARYAPHKPLLLLVALARLQQGQPRQFSFKAVEPELKQLLTEFGPSNAPNTRHLPFWHLHTDEQGKLWELQLPADLQQHPRGTAPGLMAMRRGDVSAGFSTEVEQALRAHPGLVVEIARGLLQDSFPETLHEDIAQAVGLDLTETVKAARDGEDTFSYSQRRQRNKTFRDRVLRAYEYRCCVCGFDLRLGHMPAGLEAAHIQWHTVGGPDIEPNGLSLCALHHKLFDLGAFTLEPSSLRIVFSEHAMSGGRGTTGELRHHGQDLLRPVSIDATPGARFLQWNWRNVFKRDARHVV
jgi:putative restriction endonuclease